MGLRNRTGRDRVLRHRHAGDARGDRGRQLHVPVAGGDPALPAVPLVHGRANPGAARARIRRPPGAGVLLLLRSGALTSGAPRARMGSRLHGDLQPGSSAEPGAADARRRATLVVSLRGRRSRLSDRRVAGGRGAHRPRAAEWPASVRHIDHVPASEHRAFYTSLRFTLNLTRADMIRAGYSPSVRLFEAAACGVPIISDAWQGLDTIFRPGSEILISGSGAQTLRLLNEVSERERRAIARRPRQRVLAEHTAEHRAIQLEEYLDEARGVRRRPAAVRAPAAQAPIALP